MLKACFNYAVQTHRSFRSLNIFGEHKTTEQTKVLSGSESDVYSAFASAADSRTGASNADLIALEH